MKIKLYAPQMVLVWCMYCLAVFNLAFWHVGAAAGSFSGAKGMLFALALGATLLLLMFVLLNLFFLPYLHKVLAPLILVIGAAAAYATMMFGTYINPDMIHNVFQTHTGEARSLLSWQYLGWIGLTGVLPAVIYLQFFRIRYYASWQKEVLWRAGSMILALLLAGGLVFVSFQDNASFFRNQPKIAYKINPSNWIGSTAIVAYEDIKGKPKFLSYGTDAQRYPYAVTADKPKVLVVVVGETTRAKNWGLNGYARQTTPALAAMGDVMNFPHTTSCGTDTAVSVPCMFSGMMRTEYDPDLADHRENLMDIVKRAGVGTFWAENDGGCKGVCDRIEHIDVRADPQNAQYCTGDSCLDDALLQELSKRLNNITHDTVIVLHTMGNHGPAYYHRYPNAFRHFTPTCNTNEIQSCTQAQLTNTYDNATLYVDNILSRTINMLKADQRVDSALWYFSDHGESLGEKGLYLHGAPYAIAPAEQTHIPIIFWTSDSFARATGLNTSCLKQFAATQNVSHDNLFPSVLGILNIRSKVYRPGLDIFKSCRQATDKK